MKETFRLGASSVFAIHLTKECFRALCVSTENVTLCYLQLVRRPKPQKVLRSEVTLPPSVNKTIDSRLDRGKHFESNCTCWQSQTAADCEKETISCRSSSTVCTYSNNVVTGDRVGTPWGRHTAKSPAKVVCQS